MNFYPTPNVAYCLDAKYKQKELLGLLGLPYHFLSIPILSETNHDESDDKESDDEKSESNWWKILSLGDLYDHLITPEEQALGWVTCKKLKKILIGINCN